MITPYLLYADAAAAIDFLVTAFGFTEAMRVTDDGGRVTHAELTLGADGLLYLGDPGPGADLGHALVHAYVDDVDGHHARAVAAGATILAEPADQDYGDRRYAARDLGGHDWFFAHRLG